MNVVRSKLVLAGAAALWLAGCGGDGGGINPNVPGITSTVHSDPVFREQMVITLEGRNLDMLTQIATSQTGCSQFTRGTAEPYVSTGTKAYYLCTVGGVGTFSVAFRRSSDGVVMSQFNYTVAQPVITVTSATHATPMYNRQMLITLEGQNLDAGITPSIPTGACVQFVRSNTAPYISTPTTAYYTCIPRTVGDFTIGFAYGTPATQLPAVSYSVPEPQVTLRISNEAGVSGDIVLALEATKAPITVRNFLTYVNAGFYTDTAFHRLVPDFIIQGGGYAKPLTPGTTPLPTLKATNPAITLEDNVGLTNLRGTIAMARTGVPDSATSQFFFNLADNPGLNRTETARGYAVFGHIASGLDLLDAMEAAPCTPWPEFLAGDAPNACVPNPNLVVLSATQTR